MGYSAGKGGIRDSQWEVEGDILLGKTTLGKENMMAVELLSKGPQWHGEVCSSKMERKWW